MGGHLYCANAGDCKAVLYNRESKMMKELSRDHRPNVPEERWRIELSGGFVRPSLTSSLSAKPIYTELQLRSFIFFSL